MYAITLAIGLVIIYLLHKSTHQRLDRIESLVKEQSESGLKNKSRDSDIRTISSRNQADTVSHPVMGIPAAEDDVASRGVKSPRGEQSIAQMSRVNGVSRQSSLSDQAAITHIEPAQKYYEDTMNTSENPQRHEADIFERFFAWVKHDWPLKIGGLLIILAAGWFISLAAENNWISESGRVVMGYVCGIGALVYGIKRAQTISIQGNVFLIIGIAIIFISTLAGVNFPTVQIPETLALFVMFMTVALVALVSLQQKSFALTSTMIGFGASVPLFFFSGLSTQSIFLYLLMLTIGTLWIVYRTGWRTLTAIMLGVVAFYSIGHYIESGGSVESGVNMLLALVFATVFYAANIAAFLRSERQVFHDYLTAVGIVVMYLVWTYIFGPEELRIPLLLFGALAFVGASYTIFMTTKRSIPTLVYGAAASILIAVATSELLDGPVLTVAYIIEATIIVSIMMILRVRENTSNHHFPSVLLFMLPCMFTIVSISKLYEYVHATKPLIVGRKEIVDSMVGSAHLLPLLVAMICSFILALVAHRYSNSNREDDYLLMKCFAYVGMAYSIMLIWFASHIFISDFGLATFTSLLIYMIAGVIFYVMGASENYKPYQIIGVFLFLIVLARIFIVEFWEMQVTTRILTFFVIGVLFILAAYKARSRSEADNA